MLHAQESITIAAPQPLVCNLYLGYEHWNTLFPATILNAKLLKREDATLTIEVNHKTAGKVLNVLTIVSDEEIKLAEFKPLYNATFINCFKSLETKTKYTVTADITLKGFYKIAQPFVKWLVKKRIKKFVLEPMKEIAEKIVNRKN